MQRAQRAIENPALEVAVRAADELRLPLVVLLAPVPFCPGANLRHFALLAQGVPDIASALAERRIGFAFRPFPAHSLVAFCREVRAARTIRPRIRRALEEYLVPVGNATPRFPWKSRMPPLDEAWLAAFPCDRSVAPVAGWSGGTAKGLAQLKRFVKGGLRGYATKRNRPELDGTSGLSAWLHFGHLGPHTVALAVRDADAPAADRDAFLEELIVRRELAVNFVRFNERYDSLDGCAPWALRTLERHAGDRRELVSEEALERGQSGDPLWNAAQRQMVESGWMHGYLRMYWAKEILEWSPTAAEAFARAMRLNDRYELDGRDPNGYAGMAWAIGGKHDRAWGPERPVFGTVRFLSYASTRRKFDSAAYVAKWSARG